MDFVCFKRGFRGGGEEEEEDDEDGEEGAESESKRWSVEEEGETCPRRRTSLKSSHWVRIQTFATEIKIATIFLFWCYGPLLLHYTLNCMHV